MSTRISTAGLEDAAPCTSCPPSCAPGCTECASWVEQASALAPHSARTHVAQQLAAWRLRGTDDELELMVSELVTNAYRHAAGHIQLTMLLDFDCLTVFVGADGDGRPDLQGVPVEESTDVDELRTSGYGLLLVRQMALDCGVETGEEGTTVWFQVPRPAPRSDVPRPRL